MVWASTNHIICIKFVQPGAMWAQILYRKPEEEAFRKYAFVQADVQSFNMEVDGVDHVSVFF